MRRLPVPGLTPNALADGARLWRIAQELNRRPHRTRRRVYQVGHAELITYRLATAAVVTSILIGGFYLLVEIVGML